ncbi:Zn-ribbon domain-containing OB-fold protein [Mesobacterium pallidum]|uniref:Zn-ribbon domain-containing OB-fold protein n=1 Tax=Mesobacterium pallidum TaxID=2872037 RepID=UPI001EE2238D|nr:zinc ribbon domain-containing protein [Mesobacterium pallidum]
MKATRPQPIPTADTRPFWEAGQRGVLSLPECADCGRIVCPPRPACPSCRGTALNWATLSGRGTLKGWSRIHIAAVPGREPPVTVVEVTLVEDSRAVLVALDELGVVQDLPPDAPLTIGFVRDPNGWSFPVVRPADQEGAP